MVPLKVIEDIDLVADLIDITVSYYEDTFEPLAGHQTCMYGHIRTSQRAENKFW